jgi:hypothetical protein
MLERNRSRVQNLTGLEIWFFILGRVLLAFGFGVLAMIYVPAIASVAAWPALGAGIILLVLASRGMFRKDPPA